MQRFFIVHMQKTAGTTLRDRFRNHFDEAAIYPNRTDGRDRRISVISLRHLLGRWEARRDEIRLVAGHFPLRTVDLLDAEFVTLTVLRPPVERTLSYLRHQQVVAKGDERTPLEQIYADPFRFKGLIENHMVRMLSLTPDEMAAADGALAEVPYTPERLDMAKAGLASLDLFGLQPRFEELCTDLSTRFGVDLGDPIRSNTTEPSGAPQALVDRIAEDNALDMELYEFACRLYDERRSERQSSSTDPSGAASESR
jgi:hypothetical protein